VSQFIEECRREWKRLRVPDPVANEMAADLEADLKEAEEEGASAEDVLGSGAFDPRAFAASWAAERGVIQAPLPSVIVRPRRSLAPAAIAACAAIAIIGAVLALVASPAGVGRLAIASTVAPAFATGGTAPAFATGGTAPAFATGGTGPAIGAVVTRPAPPRMRLVSPLGRLRLRLGLPPTAGVFTVQTNGSSVDVRSIGLVLLIVGIVGLIVSLLYWQSWTGPRRWSRRRAYINEGSGGPGYF
jgi:hypothetical protein